MNLTISGHHLEVTPALRNYVTTKLDRITRHFDQVVTSRSTDRREAEGEGTKAARRMQDPREGQRHVCRERRTRTCTQPWTSWSTSWTARSASTRPGMQDHHCDPAPETRDVKVRTRRPRKGALLFLRVVRRSGPAFCAMHCHLCIIRPSIMNRLASILPPAQVLVGVDATSKKRAFRGSRTAVREPPRPVARPDHRQPVRPRAPGAPPASATASPSRTAASRA
jgi:hypothetical protein